MAGAREGHLAELFREAGLSDVEDTALTVARRARELRRVVGALHARRRPGRAPTSRGSTTSGGRSSASSAARSSLADGVVHASAWTARGRAA